MKRHVTVNATALVNGDLKEKDVFLEHFQKHGWCFLEYEEGLFDALGEKLDAFFNDEKKTRYGGSPLFGFNEVEGISQDGQQGGVFKQKLSYVIGQHALAAKKNEMPEPLEDATPTMLHYAQGMMKVVEELFFFPEKKEEKERADCSFLLLDAACYTNDQPLGPPINCSSHYDPGFFALSFFSSAPGLQVRDAESGDFVDVPWGSGRGVIWAGDASHSSSQGKVARGIHRVLYGSRRRTTYWVEVASSQQMQMMTQLNQQQQHHHNMKQNITNLDVDVDVDVDATLPKSIFPEMDKEVERKVPPPPSSHQQQMMEMGKKEIFTKESKSKSKPKKTWFSPESRNGVPMSKRRARIDPPVVSSSSSNNNIEPMMGVPLMKAPPQMQRGEKITSPPSPEVKREKSKKKFSLGNKNNKNSNNKNNIEALRGVPMSKSLYVEK